jgi:hypothetical protein
VSRVYASLPLTGPTAGAGRDVLRGVQLALEAANGTAPELVVLDGFAADRDAQALANAERAAQDEQALAYLGDFHSSQVIRTTPVLAEGLLLGVTPSATYSGLGGPTLVRLMPNDRALARGIAEWVARTGIRRALVVHDHDHGHGHGVPVGRMRVQALQAIGVDVRGRPVWDHDEAMAGDSAGMDAVPPRARGSSPSSAGRGASTATRRPPSSSTRWPRLVAIARR